MKVLIEKYFEGLTSLKEEQQLRDYFGSNAVADEWKIYQPVFQYFSFERERTIPVHRNVLIHNCFRWISAAACLLLLLGGYFVYTSQHSPEISQIYIDGKKYTDDHLIRMETIRILESVVESNN